MSNFGYSDLRLVNDYTIPLDDARSAVNAVDLLHTARTYASVTEAVADCSLVYGTTAVGDRKLEHPVDFLPQVTQYTSKTEGRIALLFGSEKTGLTNESLSHCHRLMTIPMAVHGVSMNMGQAAALCLYELIRGAELPEPLATDAAPADADQLHIFDTVLRETLESADYMQRFPGNADPQMLRRLTRRLNMPARDIPIWLGFLRQILWKIRNK